MTASTTRLPIRRPLIYTLLEPGGDIEIRLRVPDGPAAEKALMLLAECGVIEIDVTRHPVQGRLGLGD